MDLTEFGEANIFPNKPRQVTVHVKTQTEHLAIGVVCRLQSLKAQIWARVQKDFGSFQGPNEHSDLHHP